MIIKGVFDNKNQEKRRIRSMLKKSLEFILAFAFLLFVPLLVPNGAWAGAPAFISPNTGAGDVQLYFFWDLRDRESFFQLTNLGANTTVHIQVFDVTRGCREIDFEDNYTTNDTHLYNVRDLSIINSGTKKAPTLTNGYGFIVATVSNLSNAGLVGNFRIVDASGYEYRSNGAGILGIVFGQVTEYTMNFNDLDGINSADVVGIPVALNTSNLFVDSTREPSVSAEFLPTLYDTAENPTSCSPVRFACADGAFDLGINQAIINSRDSGSICLGTETNGFLRLDPLNISSGTVFVAGFIGLNNGDGTGSMDTWWAKSFALDSSAVAPVSAPSFLK